jgi:hypothetical protein
VRRDAGRPIPPELDVRGFAHDVGTPSTRARTRSAPP